ncbi:hypothetical protein [Candidatus Marithrix sp. Canyon 246]|uniref:hypothetical protein n=1 Tax=Candidatus Marithrix sp. Canyon 246 TaxID=1827136 RepID=UPI000849F1DF|nr:hypothetical protein [Candidatus Marithrix sp. Canyon 246]
MSKYSLVLSDELLALYLDFKDGKVDDCKLLEPFLSYYHAPHLTNVEQLKGIEYEDTELLQQLSAQGFISQPLEELAEQTRYKIILNTEISYFPYVHILKDSIEKNFSLTFRVGENRDKAIQLITALCANAKFILIFDSYFCDNWQDTQNFFKQIIPKKSLTLLHEDHLNSKVSEIKKIYAGWKIKPDSRHMFTKSHDRYLLIDNQIEIILSSGFQYLFATDKDLTCLVRCK